MICSDLVRFTAATMHIEHQKIYKNFVNRKVRGELALHLYDENLRKGEMLQRSMPCSMYQPGASQSTKMSYQLMLLKKNN